MINYNGNIVEKEIGVSASNRGFLYGDAVFETIKVVQGYILYFEDHYFRLMSGMRITRMEIPANFTMEFLEEQIHQLIQDSDLKNATVRIRLTVYRDSDGLYSPTTNQIGYMIQAKQLPHADYILNTSSYEVELYKDFYISAQLLSNVKTNNRILNVMASVFAKENEYDNCLLLNEHKMIVEAINGNVFMVKDNVLITPPLSDGCIKGVMRKQIIEIVKKMEGITLEEISISPFDLQKADELFVTNVIQGVQSVSQYRKKQYTSHVAQQLIEKINNGYN